MGCRDDGLQFEGLWAAKNWTSISQVSTKYQDFIYLFLLMYFPDTSPIPYRRHIGVSDTYHDTGTAIQGSIGGT